VAVRRKADIPPRPFAAGARSAVNENGPEIAPRPDVSIMRV